MANRPRRLDRIFPAYTFPVYFVTFNAFHRAPMLANERVHARFVEFGLFARERSIAVGRYVIMPTHVHLFVAGPQAFQLSGWVRQLKRSLSFAVGWELPHWQEGFFDHLLRHSQSYAEKWEYVRQNPVRAGLVESPEDWEFQGEIARITL